DFNVPSQGSNPAEFHTLFGGTLNAVGNSYATFQGWANADNLSPIPGVTTIPAGSVSPGQLGPFAPPTFSGQASTTFNRNAGPYSIFLQATINLDGAGQGAFDA